jgi:hypothetical protein
MLKRSIIPLQYRLLFMKSGKSGDTLLNSPAEEEIGYGVPDFNIQSTKPSWSSHKLEVWSGRDYSDPIFHKSAPIFFQPADESQDRPDLPVVVLSPLEVVVEQLAAMVFV